MVFIKFMFVSWLIFCIGCDKNSTVQAPSASVDTHKHKTDHHTASISKTDVSKADASKTDRPYAFVTSDGKGAVASVNPIATQAGIDVFAKGGNAIDAAVAIALTLGVVDSHNSGIGGGCFVLIHTADGEIVALDGREMAPQKAHRDMYVRDGQAIAGLSRTGALAVGVPGSVAALHQVQKDHGKLSFANVLLPAAQVAHDGFPIDKVLAARLERTKKSLALFSASADIFLPNGQPLKEGEYLVQRDLAQTYRQLAKLGPDYFYRGEFAEKTAKWMAENNGIVTKDDFVRYKTVSRTPVVNRFNEYDVYGFPPPSSGGTHVSQVLSMLGGVDLAALSQSDRYHLIIETLKLAFADRAYWLGDSDFADVPKGLTDLAYLKKRAASIDMTQAANKVTHGEPLQADTDPFDKHTTHIAAADSQGNWVAITTTLNTSFGSKVTVPGTGVLLNNQMDDFSAQPGKPNAFGLVGAEANSIQAGKRPLSSMSPTIVLKDGQPVFTAGAAGGPTIISQVVQTVINHLSLNRPLAEALAMARVHHQWRPNKVFIDAFADQALQDDLSSRGHQLKTRKGFGMTQAISRQKHEGVWVFDAQSEPRIQ